MDREIGTVCWCPDVPKCYNNLRKKLQQNLGSVRRRRNISCQWFGRWGNYQATGTSGSGRVKAITVTIGDAFMHRLFPFSLS